MYLKRASIAAVATVATRRWCWCALRLLLLLLLLLPMPLLFHMLLLSSLQYVVTLALAVDFPVFCCSAVATVATLLQMLWLPQLLLPCSLLWTQRDCTLL